MRPFHTDDSSVLCPPRRAFGGNGAVSFTCSPMEELFGLLKNERGHGTLIGSRDFSKWVIKVAYLLHHPCRLSGIYQYLSTLFLIPGDYQTESSRLPSQAPFPSNAHRGGHTTLLAVLSGLNLMRCLLVKQGFENVVSEYFFT